ncbi:hypothetical protein SmB9_24000 [Sphingosinicella microcystinivorans]|uniref:Uncharacterized protein n=2 Tax=Sphingosinicella microcystinivorans TaxID=335406 RepID=A0AAD1D7F1_SPHMI|nr:hypothetical protein SmB9_24000 [Sphingosinicella microcystinivorans]
MHAQDHAQDRARMVDNFALLVSQLMMIVVLWRCFTLPAEDGKEDAQKPSFRARNRSAAQPRNGNPAAD